MVVESRVRGCADGRGSEFTHWSGRVYRRIRGRESMSGPKGSEWSNGIARGVVKPEKT